MNLRADGESSPSPSQREPWDGATLAIETVNRAGGARLPDGTRSSLRLVVYDDGGDPDHTPLAVRNLAEEEGVLAILLATSPESVGRAAEAAERGAVPLITLVAPPEVPPGSRRWTFSLALEHRQALSALAAFLAGRQADRLGWLAPRTATATTARATLARLAEAVGLSIVADESYAPGDADLDEPIGRLLSAGAEQIVGWPQDARDAARVARAAPGRLPRQRLYLGPPAATDAFLVLAGEAGVGARVVAPRLAVVDDLWDHDPLTPPARDFVRAFRLRHGRQPGPAGAAGWDAVRLLADAVERGGSDARALRDALDAGRTFVGANGSVRFGPMDHEGLDSQAFVVARVVAGGWRLPP